MNHWKAKETAEKLNDILLQLESLKPNKMSQQEARKTAEKLADELARMSLQLKPLTKYISERLTSMLLLSGSVFHVEELVCVCCGKSAKTWRKNCVEFVRVDGSN